MKKTRNGHNLQNCRNFQRDQNLKKGREGKKFEKYPIPLCYQNLNTVNGQNPLKSSKI